MNQLGNGLSGAGRIEESLHVEKAELAIMRRLGEPEDSILCSQANLACTYETLGQKERALSLQRDVYFGFLKLYGISNIVTLQVANNYADLLNNLNLFEEARSLFRETIPVARRTLGDNNEDTIRMRWIYAQTLYKDATATLDDLREAVTTLDETERIARRVFGGAHPLTVKIEDELRGARAVLRAREAAPK